MECGSGNNKLETLLREEVIYMRRWHALAIAVSMIGAIVSSSGVSAAEPEQRLWQAEAKAAQSVIAQLDAAGDQPIELSDLNLDDLGPPPWTSFVPNRDPSCA